VDEQGSVKNVRLKGSAVEVMRGRLIVPEGNVDRNAICNIPGQ